MAWGEHRELIATCPPGKKAVGGRWVSNDNAWIDRSEPYVIWRNGGFDTDGWLVEGHGGPYFGTFGSFRAVAVCGDA